MPLPLRRVTNLRAMPTAKDGKWFPAKMRGFLLGCCDCGLMHQMDFKVDGAKMKIRAWRHPAATRAIRRIKGVKVVRRG